MGNTTSNDDDRIVFRRGSDSDDPGDNLWFAAREGDYETCRSLLASCPSYIDQTMGNYDRTSLMEASRCGHEKIVKLLILKKAEIDAQDQDEKTALVLAIESGHRKIAETLVKNGASICLGFDSGTNYVTPFMLAKEKGHQLELIDMVFGLEESEDKQEQLAHIVVESAAEGDIDTVKIMKEKGLDITRLKDFNHHTALLAATMKNKIECVRALLEMDVDVNCKDHELDYTAAMFAIEHATIEVFELIIKHGIDHSVENSDGCNTLTFALMETAYGEEAKYLKILLENGAPVNLKNSSGKTPLMYSNLQCAKMLLESGADMDLQDNDGVSALMHSGYLEVAKLLIENGVDTEKADKKGNTALTDTLTHSQIPSNPDTTFTCLYLSVVASAENAKKYLIKNESRLETSLFLSSDSESTSDSEASVSESDSDWESS